MPGAIVVGGGIVGASAAYHLAAAGIPDVLLLERETGLGLGSTGRCAGGFRHQFSSELNVRLSLESAAMIRSFTATHGLPLDVHADGYLFLVREPERWPGYEAAARMQRGLGVDAQLLDRETVDELIPGLAIEDLVGATFCPDDGIADPSGLTNGYGTLARRAGATIRTGTSVSGIRTTADGSSVAGVDTADGPIDAPIVVIAAGAWSPALGSTLGLSIPVSPLPRQLVLTTAFEGRPERRTLVIDTSTMFFFHREGDGVLMGVPKAGEAFTFDVSPDGRFVAEELLPTAMSVFPAFERAGLATTWVGLYEMTPDHHPIIGGVPGLEGLLLATGFSGHGFQHAPIVGKLLGEIATTGRATTVDVSALDLARFDEDRQIVEALVV